MKCACVECRTCAIVFMLLSHLVSKFERNIWILRFLKILWLSLGRNVIVSIRGLSIIRFFSLGIRPWKGIVCFEHFQKSKTNDFIRTFKLNELYNYVQTIQWKKISLIFYAIASIYGWYSINICFFLNTHLISSQMLLKTLKLKVSNR